MSSRDDVDAIIRKKNPQRVGLHDNPWGDTLKKWVTQGYPVDEKGNPVSHIEHFGFDLAGIGGWFDTMPNRGFSEVVEETDDWVVKRNGAGGVLKHWKNKSGTPEHIDFRMTSRKIWDEEYRPHLLDVDRERLRLDAERESMKHWKDAGKWTFYGHMFIWENMRCSMGDVCMFESFLLDPDWIHDYNRVYTDFYKAHYKILLEEVGLPDGVWIYEDLGYKNGLFCSYKNLEELIFPYYQEMVEFFHSYDLPVVLHACGGITEGVPLVVEAGFDGLNPMEVKAGCDTLKFAEQYGDKLSFFGGLDARILESGDRDYIKKEVIKLVEGMKATGAGYVFGSDHSLSTNIDYEDFKYAIDVYREHMYY